MITVDLLQFVAVAFAVCGLAVVIWEIATRDAGIFREMADDARGFAERPVTRPEVRELKAGDVKAGDGNTVAAAAEPQTPQRAA